MFADSWIEGALITTMAEIVVNEASNRNVRRVIEVLRGKSFSKSTAAEACKKPGRWVEETRNRPIEAGWS